MGSSMPRTRERSALRKTLVGQEAVRKTSALTGPDGPTLSFLTGVRKRSLNADQRSGPIEVEITPGSDLLSHAPSHAVPSAVAGLTSVFGMGTGVTLPL